MADKRNLGSLVWQFAKELAIHVKNQARVVDPITYKKRLQTCMECEYYKNSTCELCGCNMIVKTKWETSRCAANPPKWNSNAKKNNTTTSDEV